MSSRRFPGIMIAVAFALLPTLWARAGIVFNVTLDTAPLVGHPSGPFQIDFQFNDGDGVANNSAVIDQFAFGGGSATGNPATTGGASGSLSTQVNLADSSFFNDFIEGFTPGSTLSFRVNLSTNFAGGTPDQFSFAILDSNGFEIPTSDPLFTNTLIRIDLDSANPTVQSFVPDPQSFPGATAPVIAFGQPNGNPVPLPPALLLALPLGLLVVNAARRESKLR